ncbi:hypothetical protein [Cryptosporangium arvum]|uniref:DUF4145 domain-containing protein n=1 Tax=Cryptosporangium arvum DSM 44712 TaxID=927661 RepID=A0A011AJ16_9ACTN|nr:hypothetical protein [Cryptosporangium arvum]EXG82016.1 hypothetical protein CryarDRAFT_3148 [Cryptosporangium arvum DSM 44712]
MSRLDPNTVRAVAEIICDIEGPYERAGWQLARFFRHANWEQPPDYDGSPKVSWVVGCLEGRADDPAAIDRALCRLCDPREYPGDPDAAGTIRDALNKCLALDGLKVGYEGGRPRVFEITPRLVAAAETAPVVLTAELDLLVDDPIKRRVLNDRLSEAATCREYGSPIAAIVMLGSVLEGLLYEVIAARDPDGLDRLCPRRRDGTPGEPSLAQLISHAHRKGWLQKDAQEFSGRLRGFRNYVHARQQWANNDWPDGDTVQICWDVTIAALNDLGASAP